MTGTAKSKSASIASVSLRQAASVVRDPSIRNVLLAGPPGVGKTTFCFMMADLLKQPAYKVQNHSEATPSEMFGMHVPDGKSFRWEPGPLDLAYTNNGILILDEIVEASGPCKTFLYGALDTGRGGEISYVGKTFRPGDKYKCFATMNGWPADGSLPEALLDRFDATFIITKPGEKQLELLEEDLREFCEDAYDGIAEDPSKDIMDGPIFTFRMLRSLQNLRRLLPLEQAVLAACRGDQETAGSFLEIFALNDTGLDTLN